MKLLRKFSVLFRRRQLDTEMAEELHAHVEAQTRANVAAGMDPEEARYAAQRQFGGEDQIKERCRDQRGAPWIEGVFRDLAFGARMLRKHPGFTVVIVLILGLGIGAATAIFSIVNGVLLKPLPYDQPGQLVQAFESSPGDLHNVVSPGALTDWRTQGTLFEGFTAMNNADANLTGAGEPRRIRGLRMTANGLQLLRARPLLGRIFAADEDQAGKDKVIVLTAELWKSEFGGAADVVGRTVALNGENFTVIGVLPPGFLPEDRPQFVIPYVFPPDWTEKRDGHFLQVYARLKPGVTAEQGRAELAAIAQRLKPLYPAWKKSWGATLEPLDEQLAREFRPGLLILIGAVALLLAIACANVANLLLARAAARGREIAVRAALGATRARLVRQLLAESLLLFLLGGGVGLAIAVGATGVLRQLVGLMNFPRAHAVGMDPAVFGWALGVSLLTGLVFGLIPALSAVRSDLNPTLKEAARGSAAGGERLRRGLIVGEVALSLVLLVGAGLLLHSFIRLMQVSPGFNPEQAMVVQFAVSNAKYPDNDRRAAFYVRLEERVSALPGVSAAGMIDTISLSPNHSDTFFRIPGWAEDKEPGFDADYDYCTPGFFRAMAIPLRLGRFFEARDFRSDRRAAIINETMARACFPDGNPLGRQISTPQATWEIVGVVGDVHGRGLSQGVRPTVYLSSGAEPWRGGTLVVRTAGAPLALAPAVRDAIHELDPSLPVTAARLLGDILASSLADRRLLLLLLAVFALAALLLAGIGLYGVITYVVGQRSREFGIRLALGADPRDVMGLVLRHGLGLAVLGLAVGTVAAFALARLLQNLLYEIKPTDPLAFAGVSLLLLTVAAFASWLPARRAAKVDPMVALRCE
ncbi:MAG TPA: ABC transporter permease [Opitutaceae bacterium]|nr:ABC transporter permease [Opitutaceae bacterium]